MLHSCLHCGDVFLGDKKQKFCSQVCARESRRYRKKILPCRLCGMDVEVHLQRSMASCESCQQKIQLNWERNSFLRKGVTLGICCNCSTQIIRGRMYCDACLKLRYRECGLKSATIQAMNRRSTNEILFAKLCEEKFSKVTTNDPQFEKWDADILVWDYKIAVLWNGPWHYRKLREKHSVAQVQCRDAQKVEAIKRCGWIPDVIRDDRGKKNDVAFVEQQFGIFIREVSTGSSKPVL